MPTVGVLTLELHIEGAHSLKEKRHTVKSLKDRLRGKFNVAVAEIDYHDVWQRSLVSAVTVSSDHSHAEQVLQSVEREAAHLLGGALVGTNSSGLSKYAATSHATHFRSSARGADGDDRIRALGSTRGVGNRHRA